MKPSLHILVLFGGAWAAEFPLTSLPLPIAPAPSGTPIPAPAYMQDNQGNPHGAAPDKGYLTGPVFQPLPYTVEQVLHGNGVAMLPPSSTLDNVTTLPAFLQNGSSTSEPGKLGSRDALINEKRSDFWIPDIPHGQMPFAGAGYKFYRNVKTDFGAHGNGQDDDTAAINRAIAAGGRCGADCGSTTTKGAMIYFPPGTYLISSPIVQYYYTQFVGDFNQRPTIKGASNFSGIALIDTDFYIPGGNGSEWYINQNQFYRQIRNLKLDLTAMPPRCDSAGQQYVPTGIHYQVAQATSLQNIDFQMTKGGNEVGIFMENGSGGFASDLSFSGGNIGWRAGSQQFTARNLQFTGCITAIQMIWDWGFTWQNIQITSCLVAFDCTSYGGQQLQSGTYQGTGSLAILDSTLNSVGTGVALKGYSAAPSLILDNLLVQKTNSIVAISGGSTVLAGTTGTLTVKSWGFGLRYVSEYDTGNIIAGGDIIPAPVKASSLLASNGKWFTQSKPQYGYNSASSFVIATAYGISNAATGDQASAINKMLAANVGKPIFFPAGIYIVQSTVFVPIGSIIVGEGWSQIMATGPYFGNEASPQVMVRVGNPGDKGIVQISDMLFTVKGATSGAILVEWNVHESTQGSAAMWDSHFRVGGAYGTNLSLADCPKLPQGSAVNKCKAASMLMHITPSASGYFENIWAWVADHDLDSPLNAGEGDSSSGVPNAADVQISVFSARGILVESQGPTWFYGTASEHSVLYQYQLLNAKNIFLGHMQTETPYYQPYFSAPAPFGYSVGKFPADPNFKACKAGTICADAWALRVLDSSNVFIYSAGLYSFFESYLTGTCTNNENCQQSILETSYSQSLWIYNLFTKGVIEAISPDGNVPKVFQNSTHQLGFTTEISAWLALAQAGSNQGSNSGNSGPVSGSSPASTTVTTITTNGHTITLTLTGAATSTSGSPPQKTTITTDGVTLTLTLPPPAPTKLTTVTTNGQTFTVTLIDATASSLGSPPQQTTITTNGQTLTFTLPNKPSSGQVGGGTPTVVTTTDASGHTTIFTDTLYPTTATNSKGQTVVGTITRGPTTASSSVTGLTTYSTFPPGASWSYVSASTNTHDSGGHPVLGPWPGCWFCPPGSGGIELFGFSVGVYPAGGPPAGLPTPFPPLTILPGGSPQYPEDPEPSCTQAMTATDITYYVSYDVNTAGSTTLTATYSTASTQITGCSVIGITSTAATTEYAEATVCQPLGCGAACNARRALQTPSPKFAVPLEFGPHFMSNLSNINTTMIPSVAGSGDWSDFYGPLLLNPSTVLLDPYGGITNEQTAVIVKPFGVDPLATVIYGLQGCVAVIAVSHRGVLVAHIWQRPTTKDEVSYKKDAIDEIQSYFTSFIDVVFTPQTRLFIMQPTLGSNEADGNNAQSQATLLRSSTLPSAYAAAYPYVLDDLLSMLSENFPSAPVEIFTYDRQAVTDLVGGSTFNEQTGQYLQIATPYGWGKAAITYTPVGGSSDLVNLDVYLQGYLAYSQSFAAVEIQIWRVNTNGVATNGLVETTFSDVPDACSSDFLSYFFDYIPQPGVPVGSPLIQVPRSFGPIGGGDNVVSGCTIASTNTYAGPGEVVTTMQCTDGSGNAYKVSCVAPDQTIASTCDGTPVSSCGTFGIDCGKSYYQLLAFCRL